MVWAGPERTTTSDQLETDPFRYAQVLGEKARCDHSDQLAAQDPNSPLVVSIKAQRFQLIESILLDLQSICNNGETHIPFKTEDKNGPVDLAANIIQGIIDTYRISSDTDQYPNCIYFVKTSDFDLIPQKVALVSMGPTDNIEKKRNADYEEASFYRGFSTFDLISLSLQAHDIKTKLLNGNQE